MASTLTEPEGEETKDQRPLAVTATPNGSPGTRDIVTSLAGSCAPCPVAVLHPGLPRATVRALDAGVACGSGTAEDGRGEALGPVLAGPAEQADSASAAVTAASRHEILTHSTVARPGAQRSLSERAATTKPQRRMSEGGPGR